MPIRYQVSLVAQGTAISHKLMIRMLYEAHVAPGRKSVLTYVPSGCSSCNECTDAASSFGSSPNRKAGAIRAVGCRHADFATPSFRISLPLYEACHAPFKCKCDRRSAYEDYESRDRAEHQQHDKRLPPAARARCVVVAWTLALIFSRLPPLPVTFGCETIAPATVRPLLDTVAVEA